MTITVWYQIGVRVANCIVWYCGKIVSFQVLRHTRNRNTFDVPTINQVSHNLSKFESKSNGYRLEWSGALWLPENLTILMIFPVFVLLLLVMKNCIYFLFIDQIWFISNRNRTKFHCRLYFYSSHLFLTNTFITRSLYGQLHAVYFHKKNIRKKVKECNGIYHMMIGN